MRTVNFTDVDWNNTDFCPCCCGFFDCIKEEYIDIPYHTMPAEFAIQVMGFRSGILKRHPPTKTNHQKKRKNRKKGFDNQN